MKHLKRTLSLILVAAMMLSMVYLAPAEPAQAAASDYISATYASNITVKTTGSTSLRSEPVSSSTAEYSLSSGTTLNVKALHKNTSGEYWYEVTYSSTTLYVAASATSFSSHITTDVTFSDPYSPACLGVGDSFPIGGTVSATLNTLGTITVAMYTNSSLSGTPALSASDTASGKSYTLNSSTIDSNMTFGSLSEDDYTYAVTAEAISYYINSSGALTKSSKTVVLEKKACIINNVASASNSTAFGVDIGYPQGTIDWSLASQEVDFAIIRIGWEDHVDTQFYNNVNGCETYGVPYGFYIYSYAESVSEAISEAEWVLEMVEGTNPTLPIYFDYEDDKYLGAISAENKTAICKAFCDAIIDAGYEAGIYSMRSWFTSYFTDSYFDTIPKWVAAVGVSESGYYEGVRMWQYSWTGSVSGIDSDVDCNYYYGDFPTSTSGGSSDYAESCPFYPAHCEVTINSDTPINTQPRSVSTADNSVNLGTATVGQTYTATGLYQNEYGNYWYRIETDYDETAYIYAADATYVRELTDDITLSNYDTPNGHVAGNIFYVTGEIQSTYNQLDTASVYIHSGFGTTGSTVTGYTDNVSDNYYNLLGSTIDKNTAFDAVGTGNYTYAISATYTNYYATGAQSITGNSGTVYLCDEFFVIVDSETDQASCTHSFTETVVSAATCTTPGVVRMSCSICGLITESTVTASHSYGSWTVTSATCTVSGSRTRTCSKCGDTQIEAIAPTGHSYTSKEIDATCLDYAKTRYTCGNCGDTYEIIHDDAANTWYETKPEGVDDSLIESKTQYRYSDYETVTSYSAALDGYTQLSKEWESSGTSSIHYVPSWPSGFDTSHTLYSQYNKTPVSASASTTSKITINSNEIIGYIYYHWCRGTYAYGPDNRTTSTTQDSTHTTFHAFVANISTIDPSTLPEASDGSVTYANANCCTDSWWYYPVPVYEQTYTTYKALFTYERWTDYSEWSDTVYTASDTRRVETRTVYRQTNAGLGDHFWGRGAITTEATCIAPGVMTYACSVCGDTYTEEIPIIDHNYVSTVTSPTCLAQGYTTHTCDHCGDSYVDEYTDITDHNYVDNVCTVCGDEEAVPYLKIIGATLTLEAEVSCNIYFNTENIDVSADNFGLLVWRSPRTDGTVDNAVYTLTGVRTDTLGSYIRSQGIAAKNMGDTLYFKIYAQLEDGTYVYSDLIDYSPKRYAYNILAKESGSAALKDLMVAMLNYGAEAQIAFNYKPYNLMNADLTDEQQSSQTGYSSDLLDAVVAADSTKTSAFVQADGAFIKKEAGITTTGALAINFFFYPGLTVDNGMTMYYWDSATYNSVEKLSIKNANGSVEMTANGSAYEGIYSNIAAKDVEETVYVVAVYESEGIVYYSNVVSYSLAQYCFNASKNSTTYKDLGEAIVLYSYYAKIYFNKA